MACVVKVIYQTAAPVKETVAGLIDDCHMILLITKVRSVSPSKSFDSISCVVISAVTCIVV